MPILSKNEKRLFRTGWDNAITNIDANDHIVLMAKEFKKIGIKAKDSLHIACAIAGKADYFLSTDDKLLKKAREIDTIISLSPLEFIAEEDI